VAVGDLAREWFADQIRTRVIGDQPDSKVDTIMNAPGPRWFAAGSPITRVHADASMFIGGLRALLLQSLHPLAMAGVAEHSDYRSDPWGRLQRTADFLAATTFGPIDLAEQAVARVHSVHRRVVGTADDGRPYAANDPHLLLWVHIVEVDSFLRAYRRHGSGQLTSAEADAYVRDAAVVARALGSEPPPTTVKQLDAAMRACRPELRTSKAARDAARYLINEPPLPLAGRVPYGMLAASAVALLPSWSRRPLQLPYLPVSEQLIVRPVGEAITRAIRWSLTPAV
jgi:uncharacterized protein (DUF2236 family)